MRLALFDLDNTLLAGDSDHSWGEFLCETGRVDAVEYRARNDAFYADYCAGKLDVVAYQSFTQAILARTEATELARWQAEFMRDVIEPIILAKGEALLREHREAGDKLVIITAGEFGPCSAWPKRSVAQISPSTESSAMISVSVGPASRSMPTRPNNCRLASAT